MLIKGLNFHFDNLYLEKPVRLGPITLYQIGDISCSPGFVLENHKQYCYEITYVVSGSGMCYRNSEGYPIKPLRFFVNRPDEIHAIYVNKTESLRYFYLGFDFNNTDDKAMNTVKKAFDSLENPVAVTDSEFARLFTLAFGEIMLNDSVSWDMIRYYVCQILLTAFRSFTPPKSISYVSASDEREPHQLIYRLVNYIDNNITSIGNLTDLGAGIGYSYAYLSAQFKKINGISMQKYYNNKRFEFAMEMLKKGATPSEIYKTLHYESLQSFSKAFHKHFGVSPRECIIKKY